MPGGGGQSKEPPNGESIESQDHAGHGSSPLHDDGPQLPPQPLGADACRRKSAPAGASRGVYRSEPDRLADGGREQPDAGTLCQRRFVAVGKLTLLPTNDTHAS